LNCEEHRRSYSLILLNRGSCVRKKISLLADPPLYFNYKLLCVDLQLYFLQVAVIWTTGDGEMLKEQHQQKHRL